MAAPLGEMRVFRKVLRRASSRCATAVKKWQPELGFFIVGGCGMYSPLFFAHFNAVNMRFFLHNEFGIKTIHLDQARYQLDFK